MASFSKGNKITQYERFLNENLRKDLRNVLDERDKLYQEVADYLQLKTMIEKFEEAQMKLTNVKTMVEIGCNFYMQAKIPDVSKILVDIGFGFYLEMTHPEALKFIEEKVSLLNEKVAIHTDKSNNIKAHIKLVLEGLREMQNIPSQQPVDFRDVLQ